MIKKAQKNIIAKSLSYESDKEALYKASEKKAWIIASISTVLLVFSLVSLFFLMPLKEVQPYLLGFDKNTGVVDPITTVSREKITENEAIHKFFVKKYITEREDYNYQTVQRMYDLTQLSSTEEVAEEFRNNYTLASELGVKGQARTELNSIALEESNGALMAIARIRIFTKKANQSEPTYQDYTIRMSYDFFPLEIPNSYRLENPLGFVVTSYRKIEELN